MALSKAAPSLPRKSRQDVDMTQGNITLHIISFAFPLLLGNIFQQLYNTVDTWVVGNYASNDAYSAVGNVGPIVNMLIGFFMGLSSGAGVVISQHYGAKQEEEVQKAVHTAIAMTLILAVVFTLLGIGLTPALLELTRMPDSVKKEATTYLIIYFGGVIGLMLYNIGAGILRAVGDSKRPFYYLVVCAVLNTGLDLLFILVLGMEGAVGVALATVLSQCVSAALVLITLLRANNCVRLRLPRLKLHWSVLKKIFYVGIPAALQLSVTAFSNIFVQSYINYFGTDCMAGWTTYSKVDQLLFLPMQSIALAATTFVGQNLGSDQPERARKGVRQALTIAMAATILLTIPILLFSAPISGFFNKKPEVIQHSSAFLLWLSPFYVLCCINQVYAGALRGAGNARMPMFIMIASFVVFRQIYLFAMARICNEIIPIAMSYPAGWLLCSALTLLYYRKTELTKTRLVETQ